MNYMSGSLRKRRSASRSQVSPDIWPLLECTQFCWPMWCSSEKPYIHKCIQWSPADTLISQRSSRQRKKVFRCLSMCISDLGALWCEVIATTWESTRRHGAGLKAVNQSCTLCVRVSVCVCPCGSACAGVCVLRQWISLKKRNGKRKKGFRSACSCHTKVGQLVFFSTGSKVWWDWVQQFPCSPILGWVLWKFRSKNKAQTQKPGEWRHKWWQRSIWEQDRLSLSLHKGSGGTKADPNVLF